MNDLTTEDLVLHLDVVLASLRYTREWHRREQNRYEFHPVIKEVMKKFKPTDYLLLALEYPHQSVRDATNVAYTQNERAGTTDRQTVTTFGRYVRRHFPEMKDHDIRDYTTKCTGDIFEVWTTDDLIVKSVQEGPKSCMSWETAYTPGHPNYKPELLHPYRAYASELGWACVVRLDPTTRQINGRGLTYKTDTSTVYVRTYKRGSDYSYADEAMQMWMKEEGYLHVDHWPEGTKLKKIPLQSTHLAPYIDGEIQNAGVSGDHLIITRSGEYDCTSTEGTPYNCDSSRTCDCCDEWNDEDDMHWVDDGGSCVCQNCYEDNCVTAMGRLYTDTYAKDDCIETVSGDWYLESWSENHGIVELVDGRYEHKSLCIKDTVGEYHLLRDVERDTNYRIIDDVAYLGEEVFYCHGSKAYFPAAFNKCVEVAGVTYHEDNVPETEKEIQC